MKFTSEIIKKAWAIRKAAAQKFGCPVSEISWKECLSMAFPRMAIIQDISWKGVVYEKVKVVPSFRRHIHKNYLDLPTYDRNCGRWEIVAFLPDREPDFINGLNLKGWFI